MSSRVGLILKKVGMTSFFDDNGSFLPVTVLCSDFVRVVGICTKEYNGYSALEIGCGVKKKSRLTKPLEGHYKKLAVEVPKISREFRVTEDSMLPLNTQLAVDHFKVGQFVDVIGISKGHGFQGVMRRHGFSGLSATHGVSLTHRSGGSTGNRQDPGRVFRNTKKPGHLGCQRTFARNLRIVNVDVDNGLLVLLGSVPGAKNSYLLVRDSSKSVKSAGV